MSSSNNQVLELDPVDLSLYLDVCSFGIGTRSYEFTRDCTHISGNLKEFGVAVVRDPRLKASDYDCFLDTMECYFKTLPDNPHLQHEVGVTPERTEVPRSSLYEEHRPLTRVGPDPKWRYFWKIGPRPENTTFKVSFSFLFFGMHACNLHKLFHFFYGKSL
ncbi:uncharacterized protein [Cicer arietinum]|uniref:Uncharacterized protein LOC105852628 n=1 Tax=Cicer arietinum TaxID=3827 RepID=A0A1S3EFU6_CICAR|nr:uncharacterized protein LOC105852628 [Cicer arietinum]